MPYNLKFKDTLYNKAWLYEQYVTKDRTAIDIAREIGCDNSAVLDRLERFGIPKKSLSEIQSTLWKKGIQKGSHAPRPRKEFKNTLHNPDWLHQKYIVEQLTFSEISRLLNCAVPSVVAAVDKFKLQKNNGISESKIGKPNYKRRKPVEELSEVGLRSRARRYTSSSPCVVCGGIGRDVSHKDHDLANHSSSNLERICRACHGKQHRYERMIAIEILEKLGVKHIDLYNMARNKMLEDMKIQTEIKSDEKGDK